MPRRWGAGFGPDSARVSRGWEKTAGLGPVRCHVQGRAVVGELLLTGGGFDRPQPRLSAGSEREHVSTVPLMETLTKQSSHEWLGGRQTYGRKGHPRSAYNLMGDFYGMHLTNASRYCRSFCSNHGVKPSFSSPVRGPLPFRRDSSHRPGWHSPLASPIVRGRYAPPSQ